MKVKWRQIVFIFLCALLLSSNTNVRGASVSIPPYHPQKRDFRAVWIATVANIDWPSQRNLTAQQQKDEFIKLLDDAADMRLNAVIVQIRPTADAFYRSKLNPWSEFLTGTEGKDPGYDPLAFMVEEAHKRNLEFHAWFNPFRVSNSSSKKSWAENSMVKQHPSWVVDYDGKKYINPGIPEAREQVLESVMEVVRNYDIDAVHFDDYFYPYPAANKSFPDDAAFKSYNRGFTDKADWRRDNVNQFIKSVYESVKAEKEHVRVGVSPFAIWRSKAKDVSGVVTTSDLSTYDSLYADTRLWVSNGWVDYIAPQIYWDFNNKAAAYANILDFWVKELEKNDHVQLYVGHASYKIGSSGGWDSPQEMPNQLKYNQNFSTVQGSIFYNMKSLRSNPLGFRTELKNNFYKYPALPPSMKWKDDTAPPEAVVLNSVTALQGKNEIRFSTDGRNVSYFVIYRSSGTRIPDITDPSNILQILRYNGQTDQLYEDKELFTGLNPAYTYVVTAVDRLHNESAPSRPVAVLKK